VKFQSRARITAMGSYAPSDVVTNASLEKIVETNDEWIVRRTGVKERRKAGTNEYTSDICFEAVRDLIRSSDCDIHDVDCIIVATVTPDYHFPSVAAQLQYKLGIAKTGAVDINAACAGFVHGLILANALVTSGSYRKILVVGGETLTKITDYSDRATCILFGDGAGAALIEYSDPGAFMAVDSETFGESGRELFRTALRKDIDGIVDSSGFLRQNGRAVYKWAISTLPDAIAQLLRKADLSVSTIDWVVLHSANLRIVEAVTESAGIPPEKVLESIVQYGNTSSASIPLALVPAFRAGKVKPGQTALLLGYGGGLVWFGVILRI
jgi:3-oxoacyl-[acyl-carrier-protein] synthase-3